jgi:hypothetical protein
MAILLLSGCYKSLSSQGNYSETDGGESDADESEHPRELTFSSEDPNYSYYEGTSGKNSCIGDQDCVISGCIESTCAAEIIEIDDDAFCEVRTMSSWPVPQFGSCGCIVNECQWYFEIDFDRDCESDDDCRGLGHPPNGISEKGIWFCRDNKCFFGVPVSK